MDKKLKVAYICHFSNKRINGRLPLKLGAITRLSSVKNHQPTIIDIPDFAIWNTNAISELSKYSDKIELHVISPYPHLAKEFYSYIEDGVYYHFFRNEELHFLFNRFNKLIHKECGYVNNRRRIKHILTDIKPDIVHCVGAENPYYSLCVLDVPKGIPVLVQLQTLLSEPEFEKKYNISHEQYVYRSNKEKEILNRADYIGFAGKHYIDIIKEQIKKDAIFVRTVLAIVEPVDISVGKKEFDFVYFSSNISKAADLALEAFIIASQKHPGLTLNIVGGYCESFKEQLVARLKDAGIIQNVLFSGKLPSHDDVLKQIRKSRFALLPLKVDLISGTVREAMANGLPVVSTITEGTPMINRRRETVLLSEIGDHIALAHNMCRLVEDPLLAETLRMNGAKYMEEKDSNALRVKRYVDIYFSIWEHFYLGTPIPQDFLA